MQAIVRSLLPLPQSQVFTKRVFQDIHAKLFILLKLFETWFDMPQPIFPFDCFLFASASASAAILESGSPVISGSTSKIDFGGYSSIS